MKIDELEKYLQSLLDTDFQVRASQDKVIILNNMLAACRSLLSLENICNSETLNDNYKVFITSSMNNFSSSFVTAAFQRLAQLNIGGNSMPGFSFPNMNMYQQVPVAPVTPVVPMAPMPQPFQQPIQPQPMPQPQFFQQPPQPQPMPQPQPVSPPPVASQPEAPQVQAQPQPQAPQPTPQPAAAAPQPAPVAPAAPVEEEEEDSSDESEVSAPSSGGSSNISFDVGLPGIGGGHDGPADGRDYLLSLLSKK